MSEVTVVTSVCVFHLLEHERRDRQAAEPPFPSGVGVGSEENGLKGHWLRFRVK